MNEIVLTGFGAITARGDWTSTNAMLPLTPASTCPAGAIEDFELGRYLSSAKTYLDRGSSLSLAATALALRDAQFTWPVAEDDADDFGITLGTHLGCVQTMRGFWESALDKGIERANSILFSHSYFNSPISLCAIEYNLRGYHGTFCAGENSGLDAMQVAFDSLRLGHAQAMLCGGVEALTPTRRQCEPDANLSEAAAFAVLETQQHARRRGARTLIPVEEKTFEEADLARARHDFGACGGAIGALSVLKSFSLAHQ